MARTIREVDEAKIRDCKEDIDTVLVFVSTTPSLRIRAVVDRGRIL